MVIIMQTVFKIECFLLIVSGELKKVSRRLLLAPRHYLFPSGVLCSRRYKDGILTASKDCSSLFLHVALLLTIKVQCLTMRTEEGRKRVMYLSRRLTHVIKDDHDQAYLLDKKRQNLVFLLRAQIIGQPIKLLIDISFSREEAEVITGRERVDFRLLDCILLMMMHSSTIHISLSYPCRL